MEGYIKSISKGLASEEFHERDKANECLLAYDLGRARNDTERENAREQWTFRMFAFVTQNGIKEAMKLTGR